MSNSNYSIGLQRLKPVHTAYMWPAQFGRKLVLGTRRKWPRRRRERDVCLPRPRRWQFFSRRDRDDTLVRLETVWRPRRRDRDHNPASTCPCQGKPVPLYAKPVVTLYTFVYSQLSFTGNHGLMTPSEHIAITRFLTDVISTSQWERKRERDASLDELKIWFRPSNCDVAVAGVCGQRNGPIDDYRSATIGG